MKTSTIIKTPYEYKSIYNNVLSSIIILLHHYVIENGNIIRRKEYMR